MTKINYENKRLMDVVDESDNIVGSKSRTDIHEKGLLHREIHVWMFDENYSIFFQKRSLHRPSAGLLDATVGGHVNKGEDYLDAAIRETKEETSIDISPDELVFLKKLNNTSNKMQKTSPDWINNFMRSVYIYKKPVKEEQIKKERGLVGVDFKRFTPDFFKDIQKEDAGLFSNFILTEELPDVLWYVNNLPK